MLRCTDSDSPDGCRWQAILVLGFGLTAALFVGLTGGAAEHSVPAASPQPVATSHDTTHSATNEDRARYGDIFFGRVIGVAGEERLATSDPDFFTTSTIYDVEVEQALNGGASGRVRVRLYGADLAGPEFPDARELVVGERYMFFGGYISNERYYSVAAGRSVIPIRHEEEAAALTATFTPLIVEANQEAAIQARQARAADPCETPSARPSIAVEPQRGAAGAEVRLTGGPFVRPEAAIWWDGKDQFLGAATIDENCTTETSIKIPKVKPGEYRIIVQDAGGNSAEVEFQVTRK